MNHKTIKITILNLSVICLLGQNVYGQQDRDSLWHNIKVIELLKLSPKGNQKRVEVLSSDFLGHDANQFLNQTPEMNGIRKAGNYATDPVLRGFKYEQLNIVVDGAANAINACPSRMDPAISQVNMNAMQSVEIYKGPYQLRYGTALGGSINFVTKMASFSEKPNLGGRLSTGYESNGNILRNELSATLSTPRLVWDILGAYQSGEAYKDGNGNEVSSAFLRYSGGTKGTFKWNENNVSSLHINTNQSRDVEFAALHMDLIYDKTWMIQAKHLAKFKNAIVKHLDVNTYYTNVKHSMGNTSRTMVSDVASQTYGARTELKLSHRHHTLYTGLDYKYEHAENISMIMPMMMPARDGSAWQNSSIFQMGWFNEYQRKFNQGSLTLAYRMDYNNADAEEVSQLFRVLYGDVASQQLNHSVSVDYTQRLGKGFTLSLLAGRGQRSASLTERFINRFVVGLDAYEMVGNPKLKPETNHQTDVVLSFRKPNIYFQIDGFVSYMRNYISGVINPNIAKYAMSSPGVRQYMNIDKALKTGVEASLSWQVVPQLRTHWAMAYTYAEDIETEQPLPEIAPLDFRWNLLADFSPIIMETKLRYVAPQNRINQGFGEMKTPDFYTVDIDARYEIFRNASITAKVYNVFNRAYAEHLSRTLSMDKNQRILAPGRNFALSFSYTF